MSSSLPVKENVLKISAVIERIYPDSNGMFQGISMFRCRTKGLSKIKGGNNNERKKNVKAKVVTFFLIIESIVL